jgi:hypothetical protein
MVHLKFAGRILSFLMPLLWQSQIFGWVELSDSASTKYVERKMEISNKSWTLDKLGRGKFNPNGSIFVVDISTEIPQAKNQVAAAKPDALIIFS